MKIAWIEDSPDIEWRAALKELVAALGNQPDSSVVEAADVAAAPAADVYVLVSGQGEKLMAAVEDVAARAPERLSRLVLVGAPLDFPTGFPVARPGSFAEALERHRLAGLLAGSAVLDWREAPSSFAGPKAMMAALGSNELKAQQTAGYAVWAVAPGGSLAAFLARYFAALLSSAG